MAALYEKVNHTEPAVLRALVQGSAMRLAPVITAVQGDAAQGDAVQGDAARAGAPPGGQSATLPGYRIRIVDGNHLPASEKRTKALRKTRAAALPGQALVVYDPATALVVDFVPGADAHASERNLLPPLIEQAGPGELWIADRHFTTRAVIAAFTARGAAVLFREGAAHPRPTATGERECVGRSETGLVYEQAVELPIPESGDRSGDRSGGEGRLVLRRIEVELDEPTEDGERLIRLLTTLPVTDATAIEVAALYRRRWTIEGMFQRLESVLQSEVRPLGQPCGALLALSAAVVAYNVLAVIQTVVECEAAERVAAESKAERTAAESKAEPVPISMYYVALEVRESYRGLMIAVDPSVWASYDALEPAELARTLKQMASHVLLEALRKHPRKSKTKRKPGYAPREEVQRHVATAKLLEEQKLARPKKSKKTP